MFPAIPNGRDNLREQKAQFRHQNAFLQGDYPAWDDCRFDGMLAQGGFEVSAQRKSGKTVWIHVRSRRKQTLRLLLPAELSPLGEKEVLIKEMDSGDEICFGSLTPGQACNDKPPGLVQIRKSPATGRRIFLGEDRHTNFYKAIDSFACAYLLGNSHQYQMLPHIFDFGDAAISKDYDAVFHRTFCMSGRAIAYFGAPKQIGTEAYQGNLGYGFASDESLSISDRKRPDDMRRDFVQGTQYNEFQIELPRGKYNVLIISGDEDEESLTHISLPHIGGKITGKSMKAGKYQCKIIPFVHEEDGLIKIGLSTENGKKWKLNGIFLSKEYYC